MTKKLLAVVTIILLALFVLKALPKTYSSTTRTYNVNGKTYHLLEARNEKEWEEGLMYVRHLDDADGMIFLFPDYQIRNFWNKNTFIDLNIVWMKDNDVVGKSFLPSIETSKNIVVVTSPQSVNKVVELIR